MALGESIVAMKKRKIPFYTLKAQEESYKHD